MIDIDGMGATNDTYGHQTGDALLATVARALSNNGAIVGRYGGDEFVSILPGAGRDEAERYRDEVLASLSTRVIFHHESGAKVPVGVSIGLAVYPAEADTPGDVIKLADSAMQASQPQESPASSITNPHRLPGKERAATLVAEIVPLLTRPGSREDKLRLVAHHLSVGAGYDAVNFEVAGERPQTPPAWEHTFIRAPKDLLDAWMSEQNQTDDHPLSRALRQTRRPIFLDNVETDQHLTEAERKILREVDIRSGLVVPMIWQEHIVGMLSVGSKREAAFSSWDADFLTAVSSQVTAIVFMTNLVEELQRASAHLQQAHAETVMMLAAAAEANDDTTGRHLQRVRAITEALARELGYSDEQARELALASVLHDIGKIRVPDSVLKSSSTLTDAEWALMREHPNWGGEFLGGRPGFELAEIIARSHHERWDGNGYPAGLSGDDVPEAATIVAVADSFDAITSDRPYRAGRSPHEAVSEIVACSGEQFSPRVVETLVRLQDRNALPLVEHPRTEEQAAA
jgi:diguanylate cyclase (GGDEF)-like protein